ncbi:MAG: alpha/beta fold hydrolase [Chryseolinea sp.]
MKRLFQTILLISVLSTSVSAQHAEQTSNTDSLLYFKTFDGVRIHYDVRGDGDAVILVHGFIVDGESWKKSSLYQDLIAKGFKVITLDMRGNGKSDKPHNEESYQYDAEAKDIMALATLLKLKKYKSVGYSRGAIITSRLLILDKRLTHAVLGGMGDNFTNPEWPRRIMFYKALMDEPVPELEGMVKYVKSSSWLDQRALAMLQKEQPSTSRQELAKVKKPVLVICGDRDEDNGSAEALSKLIPKASYKQVPGDHNNASKTPEFSATVISFFTLK